MSIFEVYGTFTSRKQHKRTEAILTLKVLGKTEVDDILFIIIVVIIFEEI